LQYAGESAPVPIRGLKRNDDNEGVESNEEQDAEQTVKETLNICDLMPHVDISSHITESLLSELRDRDWKVSIFIIIMFCCCGCPA
jgi:cytoskeleton-associated protein 5